MTGPWACVLGKSWSFNSFAIYLFINASWNSESLSLTTSVIAVTKTRKAPLHDSSINTAHTSPPLDQTPHVHTIPAHAAYIARASPCDPLHRALLLPNWRRVTLFFCTPPNRLLPPAPRTTRTICASMHTIPYPSTISVTSNSLPPLAPTAHTLSTHSLPTPFYMYLLLLLSPQPLAASLA